MFYYIVNNNIWTVMVNKESFGIIKYITGKASDNNGFESNFYMNQAFGS